MKNTKLQRSCFLTLYKDLKDEEHSKEVYIKKSKLSRSA